MPTYQPNIPTGTVNLDVDYQNIQNNFSQLNIAYGGDHVPYTDTSGLPSVGGITGMHKAIHLISTSTTATNPPNNQPVVPPAVTAGVGQVFSAETNDGVNTDQTLYFLTGSNRVLKLTRNFVPVAATNGYTFLPGGFILQWGTAALPGTGTTNFNVKTSSIFSIQTTLIGSSSSSNIVTIVSSTPGSPGSFDWHFTGSTSYTQFFWMAVTI